MNTVLSVMMRGHEHTCTALLIGTLSPKTGDLSILINLVILEHSQFGFLLLVLVFLGGGVVLLFPFLGTTTQTKHQMQRRLLLDVIVTQGPSILKLLTSEDKSLLIGRN